MPSLKELALKAIQEEGQSAFAAKHGVTKGLVSSWVHGRREIPLWVVEDVLKGASLPTEQLVPEGAMWQGRNLCLMLPWYKTTNPVTAFNLLAIWDKTTMRAEMEFGDAFIINAREKLASRFVQSECEWSLWIDDDILFPIGNAQWFKDKAQCPDMPDQFAGVNAVQRIVSHKKTIIGGVYYGRQLGGACMFGSMDLKGNAVCAEDRLGPRNMISPVDWVATGFLLVHRSVYLDIQKKFPELAPNGGTKNWWRYFTPDASANHGEDVAFCKRAREAGHQVYIDHAIHCGHLGGRVWNYKNTVR